VPSLEAGRVSLEAGRSSTDRVPTGGANGPAAGDRMHFSPPRHSVHHHHAHAASAHGSGGGHVVRVPSSGGYLAGAFRTHEHK
jgi:hypothetical protein